MLTPLYIEHLKALNKFIEKAGWRAIFWQPEEGPLIYATPECPAILFVHKRYPLAMEQEPLRAAADLLGHQLACTLEYVNPDLWMGLAQHIEGHDKETLVTLWDQRSSRVDTPVLGADRVRQEMIAQYVGLMFGRQAFWDALNTWDPDSARKTKNVFLYTLRLAWGAIAALSGVGDEGYFRAMQKVISQAFEAMGEEARELR